MSIAWAAVFIVASALGGVSTHKTRVTFNGPVRVPGKVLSAGTYFFDAPQIRNRTLVRITDESGNLVTQVTGIPERLRRQPGHAIITFGEHECGPRAIKLWLYPGTDTAVRFVYSKEEAALIASSCNEPVPEAHESTPASSESEASKVYLVTPKGQEEPYEPESLTTSDQEDQNGFNADPEH
jgi:hypothetical protein